MTEGRYDVIVAGIGAMGSAACFHLARRGKRVLGLERFDIPHGMGSSHGVNRIIRLGYAEGTFYVPLLMRAYELWRELEERGGQRILWTTGYVDVGAELVDVSLESCRAHDLRHELMDGRELARRYPGYRVPPDLPALLQPDGGFLLAEECVVRHVVQAQLLGAEIRAREAVIDWESAEGGVRVETERGSYTAGRLVVTAGAWAPAVGRLDPKLAVAERNALAWFQPLAPELFRLDRFPCFGLAVEEGIFYGFPRFGVPGLKSDGSITATSASTQTSSTVSRIERTRRSCAHFGRDQKRLSRLGARGSHGEARGHRPRCELLRLGGSGVRHGTTPRRRRRPCPRRLIPSTVAPSALRPAAPGHCPAREAAVPERSKRRRWSSSGAGVSWGARGDARLSRSSGASAHLARRPLLLLVHTDSALRAIYAAAGCCASSRTSSEVGRRRLSSARRGWSGD